MSMRIKYDDTGGGYRMPVLNAGEFLSMEDCRISIPYTIEVKQPAMSNIPKNKAEREQAFRKHKAYIASLHAAVQKHINNTFGVC